MKLFGLGLIGLLNSPLGVTADANEDLEAQRKQILKENLKKMKETHTKEELKEIETEHLKKAHKEQLNKMAANGAKHAFDHLSHLSEKDKMKVIAAQAGQGCPVAKAELTRMVEAKKEKEAARAAVLKMSSKELKEKAAEGCPYAKKRLIGNRKKLFLSTNPFRIEEKSRRKEARRSKSRRRRPNS